MAASSEHYAVLGLPQRPATLRKADVKLAYHRALLKHHPDKSGASTPSDHQKSPKSMSNADSESLRNTYTVDEITAAYKVLSDPVARAEYDRSLRLSGSSSSLGTGEKDREEGSFRTGLEIFDLDDMHAEVSSLPQQQDGKEEVRRGNADEGTIWYRSCRCGDEKGFLVREADLEREIERGEVMVGCRGCSLWAKVLFAVDEG